jgi:hypothetical protein
LLAHQSTFAAQNLPPLVINPTTTVSSPPGGLGRRFLQFAPGDIFAQRYPTYRVGVQIGLPFGNRVAEANLGRSLPKRRKSETQGRSRNKSSKPK